MEQLSYSNVLLMGRPGSGKGTQAKRLAEKFGWEHFSTGDRFKILRDEDSEIGRSVREAYDAGKLLPDWFATYLFESVVLSMSPEKGLVSEGYPRSLGQAEIFDEILSWLTRPYKVLDLAVSDELVTERMLLRAETEHRPDSATKEQIMARLATYEEHTAPVLDFFRERGLLVSIDGALSPDQVTEAILRELSA
ncbi:nucleoside monophosphate kinase [Patescibacteria group bacterium]|nr:nucleoside monophosphate kinase [Patescibacteria group bacterium]MBU1500548.1 nucleoside monophosphate kinase [Patescibacteria group bacterium]MBU2080437.1 nucleoside monophosphate kinase [Patescibacteria group bacterium]MBU2123758.1 nucleoside monophosphate kinase [Patescibacteria group bacterium]MBU2194614.1 nucleoside monophosphate kinase [Patescibacteria group bacterium]